jgi:hypothetical protein
MSLFSNAFFFPLFQFLILGVFAFTIWKDWPVFTRFRKGVILSVRRGDESMSSLEKYTGLFIAAIIGIVDKAAFDDVASGFVHYSAFITFIDLLAIVYVCYLSAEGRAFLFRFKNEVKFERR